MIQWKIFFWNVLKMSFLKHIKQFWTIIFPILKRFWHCSSNMSPRSRVRDLVISSFLNRPSIRMCCFVELSSRGKDRLGFSNCNRFVCRNIFMLNVLNVVLLCYFLEKTISETQRNFIYCDYNWHMNNWILFFSKKKIG